MRDIKNIYEHDDVVKYLEKRWLVSQYKNAKQKLTSGYIWKLDFKQRQPKWSWVYSFRINKQFRAFGYFREDNFVVVEISNHQN